MLTKALRNNAIKSAEALNKLHLLPLPVKLNPETNAVEVHHHKAGETHLGFVVISSHILLYIAYVIWRLNQLVRLSQGAAPPSTSESDIDVQKDRRQHADIVTLLIILNVYCAFACYAWHAYREREEILRFLVMFLRLDISMRGKLTARERQYGKWLETFLTYLIYWLGLTMTFSFFSFLWQPTGLTHLYSALPEEAHSLLIFLLPFSLFEFLSKVLYVCGGAWIFLLYLTSFGVFSVWMDMLVREEELGLEKHLKHFKLFQVGIAHLNGLVGDYYLLTMLVVGGAICALTTFGGVGYHEEVSISSLLFFMFAMVFTIVAISAVLISSGSVYAMSSRYVRSIREKNVSQLGMEGNGGGFRHRKLIRREVTALHGFGIKLGVLPRVKLGYALVASHEIFSLVVALLVAFK